MARNLRCNVTADEQEKIFGYFPDRLWPDDAEESQMRLCFPQYLFFEQFGLKNYRECHCSNCGGFSVYGDEMPAFFKKKHGDSAMCPQCGEEVELKALGKMRNLSSLNDQEVRFSVFQSAPDGGLLVISGWGSRHYSWGDLRPAVAFREKERQYFAPGQRMRWKRVWEYAGLCNTGPAHPVGWEPCEFMAEPHHPTINWTSDGSYFLICPERIEDTDLRWCQVEEWYHDRCKVWISDTREPVRFVHKYLSAYTEYPRMEMAVKLGFGSLVDDLALEGRKNARMLNWNAETSWGFLRLTKADCKAFLRAECGADQLRLYQEVKRQTPQISMNRFLELADRVGSDTNASRLLRTVKLAGCTIAEGVNYAERQMAQLSAGMGHVLQIWEDYLSFAKTLEYDLARRDVALPRDLKDRHDAAADTVAVLGKQRQDARYAKRISRLNEMYEFDFGGYSIVVPGRAEDIVEEGRVLRHCVGGYAARHMDGKVDILFLRKTRRKGRPFLTLELGHRSGPTSPVQIRQIHGYQNDRYGSGRQGDPGRQFSWFLSVWQDWLRHGSKRDKQGRPILPKKEEVTA